MKQYTFKATDKGIVGKAFEMAIKDALSRKSADRVSPCGVADFKFNNKNYDVKQNGTVLKYSEHQSYVKGSNRVIYATHVSYNTITQDSEHITIAIDLLNTDMFVVDKKAFVQFLQSIGCIKLNKQRDTVNVQTVYNYSKEKYHGRKGVMIEEWASENYIDDEIMDIIFNRA